MSNDDLDFLRYDERDIIKYLVETHKQKSKIPLIVIKGLASIVSQIPSIAIADDPVAGVSSSIALGALLDEAMANCFNETPKSLLNDKNFQKLLDQYYGNINAGHKEGDKVDKSRAAGYYDEAFKAADKINRTMRAAFEKREWIIDLMLADSLSCLGSINTNGRSFDEGNKNFQSSLITIDEVKSKYKVNPTDRAIEIAGFSLSNTLRNRGSLESFMGNNSIKEYDEKYTSLIEKEQLSYDKFSYGMSASSDMIEFLRSHYTPKKSDETNYLTLSKNLPIILKEKHFERMNRSFGKYQMIRGCYGFLQARFNIGDLEENIKKTETQIYLGLERMTKSIFLDQEISISQYLANDALYNVNLQKDFGRNFTILYGLGKLFKRELIMNKYLLLLAKSYRKEIYAKKSDKGKVFTNSINTALQEVLAPFDLQINPNELIDDIKKAVKKND